MSTVKRIERIVKRAGKVIIAKSGQTIVEVAAIMAEHQIGCLVVVSDHGTLAGIISERDIIAKVVAKGLNPAEVTVGEVMTSEVISCTLETQISRAQRVMAEYGIRHLPIVEDGVPVGMISSRDVMAHELSTTKEVIQRQNRILQDLECEHPGITHVDTDPAGRIIM
jgi:CBS domain-containing protein